MSEVGQLVNERRVGERAVPAEAPVGRPSATAFEWLALIAAVLPIVIAVIRALVTDWRPTFDAGYFSARALDVFTSHHPFVGSWSTYSFLSGDTFNNLGPLQLLALAPFVRLDPFWGAALGVGVVNVLAVVATWFAARRVFGPRGVIAVMGATIVLEACFGQEAWIDARQQLALLLPFWAFLWLTVAMVEGVDAAIFPWVLAGSFILQTHFSYAYLAMVLVVLGGGGFLWTNHRRWSTRSYRAIVLGGCAWAMLLWSPAIWDQLFRTGNLSAVVRHSGGERSVGFLTGADILRDSPMAFPFWWPGSVSRFGPPWSGSPVGPLLLVGMWLVLLLAVVVIGVRRRARVAWVLAVLAIAVTLTAWVTASRISLDFPQNYFSLWPISLFVVIGLLAGAARLLPPLSRRVEVLAIGLVALALLAVPSSLRFDTWALAPELDDSGARASLYRLGQRVDEVRDELGGEVVVEAVNPRILAADYYNVLSVLRTRGIDVHFPPGAHDLFRFGAGRCEDGHERFRLHVDVGSPPVELPTGSIVLLETSGPSPRTVELARELDREMGTLFDRGAFDLRRDRLVDLGTAGEQLGTMLDQPREPHAMLWQWLGTAVDAGMARVPDGYEGRFLRWRDLSFVLAAAKYTVYATPNHRSLAVECESP
jgi:hypothetical protein